MELNLPNVLNKILEVRPHDLGLQGKDIGVMSLSLMRSLCKISGRLLTSFLRSAPGYGVRDILYSLTFLPIIDKVRRCDVYPYFNYTISIYRLALSI